MQGAGCREYRGEDDGFRGQGLELSEVIGFMGEGEGGRGRVKEGGGRI